MSTRPKFKTRIQTFALVAVSVFASDASAKTIIDSFTRGAGTITTPVDGNRPFSTELVKESLDNVLGGRRTLALSDASGTMEVATEEGGSLHVRGGRGEEYEVIYGHLVRHPLNLDLTDPSTSVLTVGLNNFAPALQGTEELRLVLRTNASPLPKTMFLDVELPPTATPGPRLVSFPFAELSGNADLADVDTITLQYSTVESGFEFEISEIALVPEPSSTVLLMLGISALVRRRV